MIIISNIKYQISKSNVKFKILAFLIFILNFAICILPFSVYAISPTPESSPSATIAPSPASPRGEPSASQVGSTGPEEKKVNEIREAIKEQLNEIKDKIEKKAYVGNISEITDSTLTVTNFRGKQRVRISENSIVVGINKKEISTKDLALDDKIIALGEPDTNDTLDAKRVIVVAPPKTTPAKKLVFYGSITESSSKTSTLALAGIKDPQQTLQIKIDKTSYFVDQKDPENVLTLKSFEIGRKLIVIYPETSEGKIPLAKTIFLLP